MFNRIEEAIESIKQGKIIIVCDDEDRENEADLICAGRFATPENINFIATNAKGLICAPISNEIAKLLKLDYMVKNNTDNHQTAFTVSIDHVDNTTGISAYDRSLTVLKLIDKTSKPEDFRRPGHTFPLIAKEGGVLERPGHTEATVDLMKISNLDLCGVCCEIMDDDGKMLSGKKVFDFAKKWNLVCINIKQIQEYMEKLK